MDSAKKSGLLITVACPQGHDLPIYLTTEQMKSVEELLLRQGVPFEKTGEAAGLWLLEAVGEGEIACPTCRVEADEES